MFLADVVSLGVNPIGHLPCMSADLGKASSLTGMGLILDSSVLIAAERQGKNARQALSSTAQKIADTDVDISVVTLMELAHGAVRADTPERKSKA